MYVYLIILIDFYIGLIFFSFFFFFYKNEFYLVWILFDESFVEKILDRKFFYAIQYS